MKTKAPRARYASLSGFADACRTAGVDPFAEMRAHGLDPQLLASPDSWADAAALVETIESAAATAGCPTLGLRMAQLRPISSLGPVSLALQAEPTLAGALDLLARFWPSYNEALRLWLRDEGEWTAAVLRLHLPAEQRHLQATELAAAVLRSVAVVRSGGERVVIGLRVRHTAPDDTSEHAALFEAGVEFAAAEDAVMFRTADLEIAAPDDDPQHRAYARSFLESVAPAAEAPHIAQVGRLVEVLLPTGRCSASRVAASLAVDRRTVNRWLREEGESFTSLVTRVRRQHVERYLTEGRRTMQEVSQDLGFSTPSSFSRWFSEQYGCSPGRWGAAGVSCGG